MTETQTGTPFITPQGAEHLKGIFRDQIEGAERGLELAAALEERIEALHDESLPLTLTYEEYLFVVGLRGGPVPGLLAGYRERQHERIAAFRQALGADAD